jgi:hypothetical protein
VCGFGGCLFLRKWWTAFVDMMEARGVLRFDMLGGRTLTERFAGIAVTWLRLWTSFSPLGEHFLLWFLQVKT